MKTKELIQQLQELDPEGEIEVVADGAPIYFAEKLPACYDGSLQILAQDSNRKGYNVVGYKVTNKGNKILLRTLDLESVMWENDDAQIDLSEISGATREQWEYRVAKIKKDISDADKK
jgi:hypothetical protein